MQPPEMFPVNVLASTVSVPALSIAPPLRWGGVPGECASVDRQNALVDDAAATAGADVPVRNGQIGQRSRRAGLDREHSGALAAADGYAGARALNGDRLGNIQRTASQSQSTAEAGLEHDGVARAALASTLRRLPPGPMPAPSNKFDT